MDHSNRLEELIDKHENTLYRAALAILGNPQEAEDAVQDAYLRYLEKRPDLRDGEHEKAWLLKVTANRCKSLLPPEPRPGGAAEVFDVMGPRKAALWLCGERRHSGAIRSLCRWQRLGGLL